MFLLLIVNNKDTIAASDIRIDIGEETSTLKALKIFKDHDSFLPSNFGGISVITHENIVYHPWTEGVKYKRLKKNGNYYEWIMYVEKQFEYKFSVEYESYVSGVKIHFKDINSYDIRKDNEHIYVEAHAVYLDRCENALNPYVIGVPYLTTFNLLYANDCFVSLYFDWTKTNASQILPYNSVYSKSSVYYSQYALYNPLTSGKRNKLDETIILKVSEDLDEVLPDIPNPVSQYYEESSKRIVFDDWLPFYKSFDKIKTLREKGVSHVWHILHDWQKNGYDISLPDVYPANEMYGGNIVLRKISDYNKENDYLFALHENYVDIFKTSGKFIAENLASNPNANIIFNWLNPVNLDSSFLVKPGRLLQIMSPIANEIHNGLGTTSAYHDVSTSYDPSRYVDYDYKTKDAGMFLQPFRTNIILADSLTRIHNGPVSGEGLAHFLYAGYYDDFCAQMHTAKSLPGAYYGQTEKLGGYYKPLFVNFDLLKLKEKVFVHGMGYYSRFFYNSSNNWASIGYAKDSALSYAATELAFGHGAFFGVDSYDFLEQALIEFNYVYPVQLRYSQSRVSNILYNDNGNLITASDYIRKYPDTFDDFFSGNFMAQLYVRYENGTQIFVNRHPSRSWDIGDINKKGFFSYNAYVNGELKLYSGFADGGSYVLPASNGWFCFAEK